MKCSKYPLHGVVATLAPCLCTTLIAGSAQGAGPESVIDRPGDHAPYKIEVAPQLLLGSADFHRGSSLGAGLRMNFVLVDPALKSFNNNLALGTGVGAFMGGRATGFVPVVLQWNLFLLPQVSAYVEPGLALGFGPGVYPDVALAVGGRWHFNDKVAFNLSVGYPAIGIGGSFFF